MTARPRGLVAAAVAGVVLGACSSTPEVDPRVAANCPQPRLVAGLDETGAWTDPDLRAANQRLWRATLQPPQVSCRIEGDLLIADIGVSILASPGPASTGEPAVVRYFVSVGDGRGQILDKQTFSVAIALDGTQIGSLERLQQRLPLGAGQPVTGYEVLIGFEPTAAQIEAVRRQELERAQTTTPVVPPTP